MKLMSNKLSAGLIGLMLISTILPSCKKYEDGPLVQLSSRSERIANTWVIEEATSNGNDVTNDFDEYELYFTTDGDAELSADYQFLGATWNTSTQGTWEFQNDMENLAVDFEDNDYDKTYQILRLTKDELWLREIGADLELKLEEK